MRPRELLLVCILYFSSVSYNLAQSDEGTDFLDYKEEQVQLIAQKARENYENKCELVQSCTGRTACSRGGCSPRKDDKLECTTMLENKGCLENSTCDNVRVNFERSYVRYQKYDDENSGVSVEVRDTICSQRMLDSLFIKLLEGQRKRNESSVEGYYFNYYFGSVDGTMRFYPGLEVKRCFEFDPRIRPWYLGAISVVKDVVVLLDEGDSMAATIGKTYSTTSGQTADILIQHFLRTITSNDQVSVITFDSTHASLLQQIRVPSGGLNISDTEFTKLLLRVNETRTAPQGPSNYTAALVKAISTLNGNSSTRLKVQIILLLTDGKSRVPSEDQLTAVLKELEDQSIRLFIYEISDSEHPSLRTIACTAQQGYHENIKPLRALKNPLYSLESYFTFLARSNIQTLGSTLQPYWQPVYTDFGNLGNIITVAYPVMSADNLRLTGVAAIDIQTSGLPSILQNQVERSLQSRRSNIASNQQGVILDNCTAISKVDDDGCSSGPTDPICAKDDNRSSYKDLLCCGQCSVNDEPNDSKAAVIIAVVSVVTVLSLAGGGLLLYFRFWRPRTKPPPIVDIVKVPKFTYEQLYLATNRFSESNKLGKGTFGVVYTGTFEDGKKVAVKKLHFKPDQDLTDFEAEIRILATANHNNLLALKGYCLDQHCILVYELLENGDLDDWLFEKPLTGQALTWAQRVGIAKGTARGLAYLHEELQNDQKVCHSDIKPANILLDKDFSPKVADFGMAKLIDHGGHLKVDGGTLGYMAPEILNGALADPKADVYSYGIVLLEMVTGRRFSEFKTQSLRFWVNTQVAQGLQKETVDTRLLNLNDDDHRAARILLNVALCCTLVDPEARPDMSSVVKMIYGFLPVPLPFSEERYHNLGVSTDALNYSGGSFSWEGSWTVSQVLSRFQGTR